MDATVSLMRKRDAEQAVIVLGGALEGPPLRSPKAAKVINENPDTAEASGSRAWAPLASWSKASLVTEVWNFDDDQLVRYCKYLAADCNTKKWAGVSPKDVPRRVLHEAVGHVLRWCGKDGDSLHGPLEEP